MQHNYTIQTHYKEPKVTPWEMIYARVPEGTKHRIRVVAAVKGSTIQRCVTEAFERYLVVEEKDVMDNIGKTDGDKQ
jgi:hypothetical protein